MFRNLLSISLVHLNSRKLMDAQCAVARNLVMQKHPGSGDIFSPANLVGSIAGLSYKLFVKNTLCATNGDQNCFNFKLAHFCLIWFGGRWDVPYSLAEVKLSGYTEIPVFRPR